MLCVDWDSLDSHTTYACYTHVTNTCGCVDGQVMMGRDASRGGMGVAHRVGQYEWMNGEERKKLE